ncbi:hypothetical protein PTTG_12568 [Puccinia triticina 1-1 BBBD Race 1]|uniref:Secreted protein n=1 Tax=Puccinia triticina (isolate 1-1 / race 1 (BBBD)) TaxID=630390 RepID=A0A180GNC5_PUCT1|nr:hypothetical protein PTTG_12568 [Puccinia triticina 1-1 BBBD Race 1]
MLSFTFSVLQAIGSVAGIPVGRDTSPAATAVLAAEADHGSGALEAHSAEHALDPIPSHHNLPAENQMAVRESPRFPEGDSKKGAFPRWTRLQTGRSTWQKRRAKGKSKRA